MTHERELTDEVDLCTPDGSALNPAALGWSRRPLHRANLAGRFGLNKRWDYWAVLAGDLVVVVACTPTSTTSAWPTCGGPTSRTGATGGQASWSTVGNEDFDLPDRPGTAPLRVDRDGLDLAHRRRRRRHPPHGVVDRGRRPRRPARRVRRAPAGPRVAQRRDPVERRALQLHVEAPGPAGPRRARRRRPSAGRSAPTRRRVGRARRRPRPLAVGDHVELGRRRRAERRPRRRAAVRREVDRGHRASPRTGSSSTAGSPRSAASSTGTTTGTNRCSRGGSSTPAASSTSRSTPRYDKHTQLPGRDKGSETHQVFGTWSGRLRTDDGLELELDGLQGFAEEARQEW